MSGWQYQSQWVGSLGERDVVSGWQGYIVDGRVKFDE